MNRDSIIFSVTTFFLIALISIIAFFGVLLMVEKQREQERDQKRIFKAVKITNSFIYRGLPLVFLQEEIKDLNMQLVNPNILSKLQESECQETIERKRGSISFYKVDEQKYIQVKTKDNKVMIYEDLNHKHHNKLPLLLIGLLLSSTILILSYLAILRKLRPLKKLERGIKQFGEGDLNISTKIEGEDEISQVANSFDRAIKNISKLKQSREFFLRNIMHELKTPITKGKITTAMLEESENKNRLSRVFNRLELLISEFASIEKIIAGAKEDDKKEYRVVDLIDGAKDLLFEQGEVVFENINSSIIADYSLFTVAFKNLIENGIKYSNDKKVLVKENENALEFISNGEPLKRELEEYIKPFEKDGSDGLGLGLYVVDTILKHHGFTFEYRYEDGENIFYFFLSV